MAAAAALRRTLTVLPSMYPSREGAVRYSCSSSLRALYGSSDRHWDVGPRLRAARSSALGVSPKGGGGGERVRERERKSMGGGNGG